MASWKGPARETKKERQTEREKERVMRSANNVRAIAS